MIDIGFTELLLVAVIALVVLGPERLPQAIKMIVYWIRKTKRTFQTVKDDFEQNIGIDDINQKIHNEKVMEVLRNTQDQLQTNIEQFNSSPAQAYSKNNSYKIYEEKDNQDEVDLVIRK